MMVSAGKRAARLSIAHPRHVGVAAGRRPGQRLDVEGDQDGLHARGGDVGDDLLLGLGHPFLAPVSAESLDVG
ncbi:MAG: hypothetical protein ACRDOE_11560, partial [Streptosporangiaceae bacterium]